MLDPTHNKFNLIPKEQEEETQRVVAFMDRNPRNLRNSEFDTKEGESVEDVYEIYPKLLPTFSDIVVKQN